LPALRAKDGGKKLKILQKEVKEMLKPKPRILLAKRAFEG
jgi:hypothetical protein